MSSKWNEQFGAGAILESTDGATYNEIKPIIDPKAPKENEIIPLNVPSLAGMLLITFIMNKMLHALT